MQLNIIESLRISLLTLITIKLLASILLVDKGLCSI